MIHIIKIQMMELPILVVFFLTVSIRITKTGTREVQYCTLGEIYWGIFYIGVPVF